ncbi:MAG: hypothetical protein JOZ73_12975 [Solirubrobacterales bacterium]|nr:hypothetical protein [Solirubrobacterales bacterium]
MAAILEPPVTEEQLRERAEELADDVEERLLPVAAPEQAQTSIAGIQESQKSDPIRSHFEEVRRAAISLSRSPAWRSHDLTTELLLLVEQLRDTVEADQSGNDPEWRIREVLQRIIVVLRSMVRRLEHDEIDRPEQAAHFVAQKLADVQASEVAELLDTSVRMVNNYRQGVGQIRKNPNRVTLIGQLVYELVNSMTHRGVVLWFDARTPALRDRSPRELIDEDPVAHRAVLINFARGGRAQLDRGAARYGDLAQGTEAS